MSITRRSALLGSSIAGMVGVPTLSRAEQPIAMGPDAELIRLYEQFVVAETELWLLPKHDEHAPDFGPNHSRYEHVLDERDRLRELIEDSPPPTSPAGIAAAARAALTWVDRDYEGNALYADWGEQLLLMLAEGAAAGFVWPPRPGSCSTAHWAPQMTPAEVVKYRDAAAAASEARAEAYREAMARERAARRAEKGIGTVPAGEQELLGMDVDGSLYVWDTGNIEPITGFDNPGPYISGGHYLIWWKGRAVVVHLSSQTDLKICVHFMCNSGPNLAMERQEVEDIVVGKRIEDPEHHAKMMAAFDRIAKATHAGQTHPAKLRGKVLV